LHNEWLEKKKIRDAKIAKGEPVGPLERDPTQPTEVGLLGLLKFILYVTIFFALAGKFVTGSYTWEYETRWLPTLKSLWPVSTSSSQTDKRRLILLFDRRTNACSPKRFCRSTTARPGALHILRYGTHALLGSQALTTLHCRSTEMSTTSARARRTSPVDPIASCPSVLLPGCISN
jgi:hypothetical protein